MTESEWLASRDVNRMLEAVRKKLSERKARLFAVGCARLIPVPFADDTSREVIATAERHADGLVAEDEWIAASSRRMDVKEIYPLSRVVYYVAEPALKPATFAERAALYARSLEWDMLWEMSPEQREEAWASIDLFGGSPEFSEHEGQSRLLREIVGNPFRPRTIPPHVLAWERGTVRRLAEAIDAERAFDRTPILADALEDAGCTDVDILGHLRSAGPHVRGCWALDLILGKG